MRWGRRLGWNVGSCPSRAGKQSGAATREGLGIPTDTEVPKSSSSSRGTRRTEELRSLSSVSATSTLSKAPQRDATACGSDSHDRGSCGLSLPAPDTPGFFSPSPPRHHPPPRPLPPPSAPHLQGRDWSPSSLPKRKQGEEECCCQPGHLLVSFGSNDQLWLIYICRIDFPIKLQIP